MRALALDTSSGATSCALVELEGAGVSRVMGEALLLPPQKAGDLLPAALAHLCAGAGVQLQDISALAVGVGPGSFTGLRVGLACAKGLAYALRAPLAGASSLRALALAAAEGLPHGEVLVPALEARKGELFVAAYAPRARTRGPEPSLSHPDGLVEVAPAEVLATAALPGWLRPLPGAPLVCGPGARRDRARLLALGVPAEDLEPEGAPRWPSAAAVAALAAAALQRASFDAAALFALAPDYLAPSEAEKALAEGRVGKLPA